MNRIKYGISLGIPVMFFCFIFGCCEMKTIVILTEDASNLSVNLISSAIEMQCQQSGALINSLIIEKKLGDGLMLEQDALIRASPGLFPSVIIPLEAIAFVMVRTWTDKREPVITLAAELEARGIDVLDSALMPWTLSKVAQYRSLQDYGVFPESVCLDENWMSAYEEKDKDGVIQQVKADASKLGYPMIIKASRGSRGTGVYRVRHEEGLAQFLSDYLWGSIVTPVHTKRYGLILQKFIYPSDASTAFERSIYLRINVVNQEICSVVQFELGWQSVVLDSESRHYEKIEDKIPDPQDKPIELNSSLMAWYQHLLPLLPFPLGVVGLDIMRDVHGDYYLLEVNCGPAVSLIEDLGTMHSDKAGGEACLNFSSQIAHFCLHQALNKQKIMQEDSVDAQLKIQSLL